MVLLPLSPSHAPVLLRTVAGSIAGAVATLHVDAAAAATAAASTPAPPIDDRFAVGFAFVLVALVGWLQFSLGDVAGDEAMLPSSVNLINKNRQKRSNFLKGGMKKPEQL